MTAVLYPLLTCGLLLLFGLLALATLLGAGPAVVLAVVVLPCVLLAGAHWALLLLLRGIGLPRPGATAALLTASAVLSLAQAVSPILGLDIGWPGAAPFVAALQGAAVAAVLIVSGGRALGWACAAVCGLVLAHALLALATDAASGHGAAQEGPEPPGAITPAAPVS
ncbi:MULTISPECIES: hypothetical protein [unclassified Nocardiopsis]|uniref:hypothetical protein n=1 Tax=unclassified Nocardiopsis TaxID=2649073 RepID=UPI001356E24A|nr:MULTISPECIES: hypothetical protein [unclassified Nocardiopsis]